MFIIRPIAARDLPVKPQRFHSPPSEERSRMMFKEVPICVGAGSAFDGGTASPCNLERRAT
jgi:hypothetical protein